MGDIWCIACHAAKRERDGIVEFLESKFEEISGDRLANQSPIVIYDELMLVARMVQLMPIIETKGGDINGSTNSKEN